MKQCKPLMIQGTASSSGKSLITAALCRIFHEDGFRVSPFKAQNMSNNSFVTRDGLEMGRAQVVQAYASGLEPDVHMNPVLLKPSSDTGSQVVLKGKPSFTMNAHQWHETRNKLRSTIQECYDSLSEISDIIVIEGAGSPAEINLKKNDIVNMGMAQMVDAPVLLVGDIDRGGVFASLAGTMLLLDEHERQRIKGFIINKFRGDVSLLKPGLEEIEKITGVPVLGVVPWILHAIDEEDGVSERFTQKHSQVGSIDICIIRLPHISNYTDFIPLENIPDVNVYWCDKKESIGNPDLLIIPGTKATISDLQVLKERGIASAVAGYVEKGGTVIGVCGGFQMLGQRIMDPDHTESIKDFEDGLGMLDMITVFHADKTTDQTTAFIHAGNCWLWKNCDGLTVNGYEIHMGQSKYGPSAIPFTRNADGNLTGISDSTGRVCGTYLHGLFDSSSIVTVLINSIRNRKDLPQLDHTIIERKEAIDKDIQELAGIVRESLDLPRIKHIMGLNNDVY